MGWYSSAQAQYKLTYVLSPIILTGGVATNIAGGALPIISITQAQNFDTGVLSSSSSVDLDDYFAEFMPIPGATVADNAVGMYPFANQTVAANAIVSQPQAISMLMVCPVRSLLTGYLQKQETMSSLLATLDQHDASGGTYTVITLSKTYTNCLRTRMTDASLPDSKQSQNAWRIDFIRPLLTLEQAQQAQNSLMSQISNGTAINGQPAWSGASNTVGNSSSLASSSVVPAASGTGGTAVGPLSTGGGASLTTP